MSEPLAIPTNFFGKNIKQRIVFFSLYSIAIPLTLFLFWDVEILDRANSGNILSYTIYLILDVIILFFMMRILYET